MKFITIACLIQTIFILIQPVAPGIIRNLTNHFAYTNEQYLLIQAWAKNNWYVGLFPEGPPAAFFASMLIGCGLFYLFKYKNRLSFIQVLLGLGVIVIGFSGILLTAKRGSVLAVLGATLVTYFLYNKARKVPIFKGILLVFFICLIGWVVINNTSIAQVTLDRFFNNDNFFTYRTEIYANMWSTIKLNPIFGTGTGSANDILGIGGHNIYLTILLENGIFGVFIFIILVLYQLILSAKNLYRSVRVYNNYLTDYLIFSIFVQVVFIIYGMSGNPLYDNYILYFYFVGVLINANVAYRLISIKNNRKPNIESMYSNISISL